MVCGILVAILLLLQAGNNMAEEQKAEVQKPWEMGWIKKQIQPLSERTQKAASEMLPWEMPWKQRAAPSQADARRVPQQPAVSSIDKYIDILGGVESGNNPNAKAKTSSATGLHQFTEGTWMNMVNKLGLDYTLSDRKDPQKSREVTREFTKMNAQKAEQDLGRKPTMTDLYMYHFAGPTGAPKLLKAPPDAPAIEHASEGAVKANKPVFFHKVNGRYTKPKTVEEVIATFRKKFKE